MSDAQRTEWGLGALIAAGAAFVVHWDRSDWRRMSHQWVFVVFTSIAAMYGAMWGRHAPWLRCAGVLLVQAGAALVAHYDRVRMGRVSYESAFMWLAFVAATFAAIATCRSAGSTAAWVLIGLCAAGLERTLFGVAFHLVHSYEVEHEKYHTRLRQKFLAGTYVASDDRFEVVTYSVVFLLWGALLWVALPAATAAACGASFFCGLTAEHLIGQRLRGAIQYNRLHKNKNATVREWTRRFEANAELYYFYHMLVNSQCCAGFSSPFWDTLLGRNPFPSRVPLVGSLPIPFLDFWFVDYEPQRAAVDRGWRDFVADPAAFEARMLALSQQWRGRRILSDAPHVPDVVRADSTSLRRARSRRGH